MPSLAIASMVTGPDQPPVLMLVDVQLPPVLLLAVPMLVEPDGVTV